MPNIQLADNLRYLRQLHKLTQKKLSKMLNISRQAYSNYENKRRVPDLDSLLFLSQLYQVNLNDLVLVNLRNLSCPALDRVEEEIAPYMPAIDKKAGNTIYLSEEEADMLMQYRTISDENKKIIAGFIKANSR